MNILVNSWRRWNIQSNNCRKSRERSSIWM